MYMFKTLLDSIPKNRSEFVEELVIPQNITMTPYTWTEPEDLLVRSDSLLSGSSEELGTISTDSSMPLSRAMTDSEIDYGLYRRMKSRSFSDPWCHLKAAMDAFPPDYLTSLKSFQNSESETPDISVSSYEKSPLHSDDLRLKMERFFDEECSFFAPDDPGLLAMQEALDNVDLKNAYEDVDSL